MIISFIVCPNGNGHLFRTLDIIDYLKVKIRDIKINIFCSKFHKKKIEKNINFKNIKVFSIIPNYDLRNNPYGKLLKLYKLKLKNHALKKSRFIISDNLVNKYLPENKTILHANFFWGDVFKIKSNKKSFQKLEKNFINEKIKYIFANRYFFINQKKINTKKILVGFTGQKYKKKINFKKKFLEKKILVYFSGNDKIPKKLIFNLLDSKFKIYTKNYTIAKLSNKIIRLTNKKINFEEFGFILTKPGLGSIKDCLNYKIFPIFYFRKNNLEYKKNFNKFKKIKEFFQNETSNEKKILQNFSSIKMNFYMKTLESLNKFKFDGNELILKFLKKNEKKI